MKQLDHQFKNSWQEIQYGALNFNFGGLETFEIRVSHRSNYYNADGDHEIADKRRFFSFVSEINHFLW